MTLLDYHSRGTGKNETINALESNTTSIRAIGEIQLLLMDNVLKNWTERKGYCIASQGRHFNEIIFHY